MADMSALSACWRYTRIDRLHVAGVARCAGISMSRVHANESSKVCPWYDANAQYPVVNIRRNASLQSSDVLIVLLQGIDVDEGPNPSRQMRKRKKGRSNGDGLVPRALDMNSPLPLVQNQSDDLLLQP